MIRIKKKSCARCGILHKHSKCPYCGAERVGIKLHLPPSVDHSSIEGDSKITL